MEMGDYLGSTSASCNYGGESSLPNGDGHLLYLESDKFNRKSYRGQFNCGQRHGNGLLVWKDSAVYYGQFDQDKRSGQGVLIYPNGDKYIGNWTDDVKNGYGTYHWQSSGDKYEGFFKNGKKEGNGKYTFNAAADAVFDGIFENDQIVLGTAHLSNNDEYRGEIKGTTITR